jgi:hypothetical protein
MVDEIVHPSQVDNENEVEEIDNQGLMRELEARADTASVDPEVRFDDARESFLKDAVLHEDGTITGGPALIEQEDELHDSEKHLPFSARDVARTIDGKVDERFVESDSEPDAPAADDIPDEVWVNRPVAERELWERVRPRHVRREAARVKALKLPAAAINRIEKYHPDLQTKTSESLEVMNYATVLLLQAIARAIVGRKGAAHSVRFEDLRQVCANTRELQFLLPLSGSLDNSALMSGNDRQDLHDNQRGAASNSRIEPDAGQSTLNRAAFARLATAVTKPSASEVTETPSNGAVAYEEVIDENSAVNFTPEKVNGKRKLSSQEKHKPSKAQKRGSVGRSKTDAGAVIPSNGLSNFFKRIDAASN